MPVTLLAVDDSVTMRRVFEMTFEGESFHVVTADSADAALAAMKREKPAIVLVDLTLPGKTGYDLCALIKRDYPNLPVVLVSSKLNPYDKVRGQVSKADDNVEKPFDTQKLIDRVNSLVSSDGGPAPMNQPPKPVAGSRPAGGLNATLIGQGQQMFQPRTAKLAGGTGAQGQQDPFRSTSELSIQNGNRIQTRGILPTNAVANQPAQPLPATQTKQVVPQPRLPTVRMSPSATADVPVPPGDKPSDVSYQIGPDLSRKLGSLGLTKEQVESVIALSREIVERVVWEVVPVLAEAIIKEELKRLTEEN